MDESDTLPPPPPADETDAAPPVAPPMEPAMAPMPPMAMGPPMKPSRPGTVTLAAILLIVWGLLVTLGTVGLFVTVPSSFWDTVWELMPAWGIFLYLVLIISILQLVMGAALFTMKRAAWIGALVVQLMHLIIVLGIILIPTALVAGVSLEAAGFLGTLLLIVCSLPLIFDIVVLILLILPNTRLAFT